MFQEESLRRRAARAGRSLREQRRAEAMLKTDSIAVAHGLLPPRKRNAPDVEPRLRLIRELLRSVRPVAQDVTRVSRKRGG